MKILVRADASHAIGSGHVMRCLALVEHLRPHATDIHFVCRRLPGEMHDLIEQKGFRCSLLPDDAARDAEQTASVANNADWLIVDHYGIDARWERALRPHCRRLMVIDDLADRSHDCNLLLDQTFGRGAEQYRPLVSEDCIVLAGAAYALLRAEFAAHRSAALARREQCERSRTVLVTMGGSDPANKTLEVLEALAGTAGAKQLQVTVVVGALYAASEATLAASGSRFEKLDVRRNVSNMAELMAASDIAIGAAGTTSWERCCLGLPTLTYVYADNQREAAKNLEATGAIRTWRSAAELEEQLEDFMQDASLYQSAVAAASAVCDGLGVERVVSAMRSVSLSIRKAKASDSTQFLDWRNDPVVVASSFTKGEIRLQDHQRWYDQKLASDDCALYVVEYDAEPAAQVRFDIDGDDATVNYSVGAAFRGQGLATVSMSQAIAAFRREHTDVNSLVAYVKPDNIASCRVFEKLQFDDDGTDSELQANRYRMHLAGRPPDKATGDD